jgi:hypothetical protein
MRMHTRLRDTHVYLFRHWVLELLEAKPNIESIQGDLIPYLLDKQFSTRPLGESAAFFLFESYHCVHFILCLFSSLTAAEVSTPSQTSAAYRLSSAPLPETSLRPDPLRCFAYVAPLDSLCVRVNTLPKLFLVNNKVGAFQKCFRIVLLLSY